MAFSAMTELVFFMHNKTRAIASIWRWERVAALTMSARRRSQKRLMVDFPCRRNFGLLVKKKCNRPQIRFFSTNIKSINWLELGWKKWFRRSFLKFSMVAFQNIFKKCYFSFSPGSKQNNNVSTHSKLTFWVKKKISRTTLMRNN